MSLEERSNLNILKKYYDISLSIVKNILGEEEVDYLMDGKEVFLDVNYEKTGWFGLCDDNGFFCKIQVNSDLFYMKKNDHQEIKHHYTNNEKNVKELFLKSLHIHKDMYLVVLKIKILLLMKKQIKQKQKYRNIITSSHGGMI